MILTWFLIVGKILWRILQEHQFFWLKTKWKWIDHFGVIRKIYKFWLCLVLFHPGHEGTLIHALSVLSLWCLKFTRNVPEKLIAWFKSSFTQKNFTSPVRSAVIQCMNFTFNGELCCNLRGSMHEFHVQWWAMLQSPWFNAWIPHSMVSYIAISMVQCMNSTFNGELYCNLHGSMHEFHIQWWAILQSPWFNAWIPHSMVSYIAIFMVQCMNSTFNGELYCNLHGSMHEFHIQWWAILQSPWFNAWIPCVFSMYWIQVPFTVWYWYLQLYCNIFFFILFQQGILCHNVLTSYRCWSRQWRKRQACPSRHLSSQKPSTQPISSWKLSTLTSSQVGPWLFIHPLSHPFIRSHPSNPFIFSHPSNPFIFSHPSNVSVHPLTSIKCVHSSSLIHWMCSSSHIHTINILSHPSNAVILSHPSIPFILSHPSNAFILSHPYNASILSHPERDQTCPTN